MAAAASAPVSSSACGRRDPRRGFSSSSTGSIATPLACCSWRRSARRWSTCTRSCAKAASTSGISCWFAERRDAVRAVELSLERYVTGEGERRVRVDREGRVARTVFRRVRIWPHADPPVALLEAELETGRTHQIRVHLTHLGFPLAGDDKYGDFTWNRTLVKQGLKRMFLHAHRIRFAHPLDGREVTIEAPLAPDLARFVAQLDASADASAVVSHGD
jgi:hypothetical protein